MIPKKIFIIPYRNREQHKALFTVFMKHIMEDEEGSYKFLFIHQTDTRPFNRGAMKNIGFIYVKNTYPNHYKNITLIFHDIDLMPYKKGIFDYDTTHGTIKHYYGYVFTLGGMFSVKGSDFERINGFPNYWSWGFEDNLILVRWNRSGGKVDRSQFLPIQHPNVLASYHSYNKVTSKTNENKFITFDKHDEKNIIGISTIRNLNYNVENIEKDIHMVNVKHFDCEYAPYKDTKNEHLSDVMKRFNNSNKEYIKQQTLLQQKQNNLQRGRIQSPQQKRTPTQSNPFGKNNFRHPIIGSNKKSFVFKF